MSAPTASWVLLSVSPEEVVIAAVSPAAWPDESFFLRKKLNMLIEPVYPKQLSDNEGLQ